MLYQLFFVPRFLCFHINTRSVLFKGETQQVAADALPGADYRVHSPLEHPAHF